jgi:protein-tyrosine phosphatase
MHKHVCARDEEGYDMISNHWEECHEFLKQVRDGSTGGRVVVHCVAGINRSGLIACAAHLVLERATVLDVVENALKCRGPILWNRSFQEQLCVLACSEDLLGDEPLGFSDKPIEAEPLPPPPKMALDRLF